MSKAKLQGTKIRVTKSDIRYGEPESVTSCPIALAVMRATRRARVSVDGDEVIIAKPKSRCVCAFPMPAKAGDFVSDFDGGEKVRPFSFVLRRGEPKEMSAEEFFSTFG
jgi:hypothetical protein